MIAVDGGDEVDVRAVGGEALDVDLDAEALDGGRVPFAGKGLNGAGGKIALSYELRSTQRRLPCSPGSRRLGSSSLKAMRLERLPGPRMTGSTAM